MVGVQDLPRVHEIEVVVRERVPRQRDDPLEVRPDHAVLRGRLRKALEALKLAVGRFACLLRQLAERFQPLPELRELCLLRVGLAELGLDRLQLLAQEVLPLALLHLGLNLRLDA